MKAPWFVGSRRCVRLLAVSHVHNHVRVMATLWLSGNMYANTTGWLCHLCRSTLRIVVLWLLSGPSDSPDMAARLGTNCCSMITRNLTAFGFSKPAIGLASPCQYAPLVSLLTGCFHCRRLLRPNLWEVGTSGDSRTARLVSHARTVRRLSRTRTCRPRRRSCSSSSQLRKRHTTDLLPSPSQRGRLADAGWPTAGPL